MKMLSRCHLSAVLAAAVTAPLVLLAQTDAPDANAFPPAPPVQPLTPAESMRTIQLQPGYHLELVLSEPDIKEPVLVKFDGDGRMFVAEMRSYMQDADATGEMKPTSCVSLHWSSKGDGKYDRHTIFADKLLLPRILLPLDKNRVIIGETNTLDLFLYTDTNGDGVADKKEPFFVGGPRGGNMEHQPNGLLWGMDNWLYSTFNPFRLRWTPGGVVREETPPNGGQWGVSQDDLGKPWFIDAGGERGPVNYQVPIIYGQFQIKQEAEKGWDTVWPLVGLADVQGGTSRFRPADKTLNHFTATCGLEVFRGDQLPAEIRGDIFFGEPVGRLIRRGKVTVQDGLTTLTNPYAESEFIRSTDPLFRPIGLNNAPDGTLFITDMYRGIIQEGNWTRPGSYLRKVVDQLGFAKPVGRGRIYRLVHDGLKPGPQPRMNGETPAQLVAHLAHPNGWWRDTAQKLLVLKQDRFVVPALMEMARSDKNPLARLHALWTLEGLDALTPGLVREVMKASEPELRVAAIRLSESLWKKGDQTWTADIASMRGDQDIRVVQQAMLTGKLLNFADWKTATEQLVATHSAAPAIAQIGNVILNPPAQPGALKLSAAEQKIFKAGETTFQTLCAACHGADAKGAPMLGAAPGAMLAPPLAGSKTINGAVEGPISVLLHGLTGDIDGKKYEGQMIAMADNSDEWIASVLSYVRNNFGNHAGFVKTEEVARLRAATKSRTQPWTVAELRAAMPQPLTNRQGWKLTASHAPTSCAAAVDGDANSRYTTETEQKAGMWFQIELPLSTALSAVKLEALKSPSDFPRSYRVELSDDGKKWTTAVAAGSGGAITDISLGGAKAKFIRITTTADVPGKFWSIHELKIFTPGTLSMAAK